MNNESLLSKNWKVLSQDSGLTILERLLKNRGLETSEEVTDFINPSITKMHDPYLMEDMDISVLRIKKAIEDKERIMIFGDYDVDGVTATAILMILIKELGGTVSCRLPDRRGDGYGLSENVVKEISETGSSLLITTDCGISCAKEVQLAKSLGMDIIITDHHTIPEQIPEAAHAILHPQKPKSGYPYRELTGAGVSLKLAIALIKEMIPIADQEKFARKFFDLASLGTLADMGPLTGENRVIVKEGLKQMRRTNWEGLKHLTEICGIKENDQLHTNHISFRIAPRLNAAGRIETPYYALKLFLEQGQVAQQLAQKLEEINQERRRLTEIAMKEVEALVKKQIRRDNILIAYHPNWHSGLIGIIAGKLASKHGKPVIIMEERNNKYIGSARGPEYYNLVEALKSCEKYLEDFGGHVQAAGFTLPKENRDLFIHNMQVHAREFLGKADIKAELIIDSEVDFKDISFNLLDQIDTLRPFGMKNERPLFLIRGAYLQGMRRVGHDRKHLLGKARLDQKDYKFIAFNFGDHAGDIPEFSRADLVCHLDRNNFRGNESIELQVVDLRVSG